MNASRIVRDTSSPWFKASVSSAKASRKRLTPPVVQIRRQPFLAAQRGDALLAAQPFEHDPNLLLGRNPPAGPPPDVLHDLSGEASLPIGLLLSRLGSVSYSGPHWSKCG